MATYNTFCPIAKTATVLCERWTVLILRELMYGSTRFNQIERGITGISRAVLAKRLRALVHHGIVATGTNSEGDPGYFLTDRGEELLPLVTEIGEWGQRWFNRKTRPNEVDPDYLIWDIHRRIDVDKIAERHFVVEIAFHGLASGTYWLVIKHGVSSVSLDPPGFSNDIVIEADTLALHDVWLGRTSFTRAMSRGEIRVHGPPHKAEAFVKALRYSAFAKLPPGADS